MGNNKIENLDQLLRDHLGPEKSVSAHESKIFTAPGDNLLSIILSLKISITNKKHLNLKPEILEVIAKIPPHSEFIQKIFKIPTAFANEIEFYFKILPALENFIKTQKDFELLEKFSKLFPKSYGARININNDFEEDDQVFDNSAVLLLENLKLSNFHCGDRLSGFDFESSKLILKSLAKFHAVPLAMKMLKPQEFQEKIKNPLRSLKLLDELMTDSDQQETWISDLLKLIQGDEECRKFAENIRKAFANSMGFLMKGKNDPKCIHQEHFATIIHTDAWVNNFMLKYHDGKPLEVKIIDFQLYEYGSLARDFLYFILTSVCSKVLQDNLLLDDLIEIYYESLVEVLRQLKCDVDGFSFEGFQEELSFMAGHAMLAHFFGASQNIFNDDVKVGQWSNEEEFMDKNLRPMTELYKKRVHLACKIFRQRKWI